MRTTLNIDDDVLHAAKEMARQEGASIGSVISRLARRGLKASTAEAGAKHEIRNGVPLFPSGGEVVTLEHIRKLMDEEGI